MLVTDSIHVSGITVMDGVTLFILGDSPTVVDAGGQIRRSKVYEEVG